MCPNIWLVACTWWPFSTPNRYNNQTFHISTVWKKTLNQVLKRNDSTHIKINPWMQRSIAATFHLAFISLFYWQLPKEKKNMPPTQQKWGFVLPPLFSNRKEFNYWFRLKAFELHRLNKQPPGFRAFHPPAMANHFPYHFIGETVNALLFQLSVQDNNSLVCETENGQWKEPHPDKDRLQERMRRTLVVARGILINMYDRESVQVEAARVTIIPTVTFFPKKQSVQFWKLYRIFKIASVIYEVSHGLAPPPRKEFIHLRSNISTSWKTRATSIEATVRWLSGGAP